MRIFACVCLAAAATTLAGCSQWPSKWPASASSATARPVQKCDTAAAQWAVGKTNTEHNVAEARQRSGAYMARVLRAGQPTTREFNAERLNLEVDATGRVIAARCG